MPLNESSVLDSMAREQLYEEALLAYFEAKQNGPVDKIAFRTRYNQVAEELVHFFTAEEAVDDAISPLSTLKSERETPGEFSTEASSIKEVSLPAFGKYDEFAFIKSGGMGAVYSCRDRELGRSLAMKVMHSRLAHRADFVRDFQDEAQVASQLTHPNIAPVHERGTLQDGRPYFTMKLVQGQTFLVLIREYHNDPSAERFDALLRHFVSVCNAVAYAHQRQILHRDLKPENVMVGAFGEVQVMDWGLSKLIFPVGALHTEIMEAVSTSGQDFDTEPGLVRGTFAYMPPEQANAEIKELDACCDVFALGSLLCEILTNVPPYTSTQSEPKQRRCEVWEKARTCNTIEAFERLDTSRMPVELVTLVKHCLASEPSDRPTDAATVAKGVTGYLAGVQEKLRFAEVERARAEAKAIEDRKRRRWQLGLAAAMLLFGLAGAGGWQWYRIEREQRVTREQDNRFRQDLEVGTALDEFDEHLRHQRLASARSALARAEGRAAGAPATLGERLRQANLHLTTANRLDEIRLGLSEFVAGKPDFRRADREFADCFRTYFITMTQADGDAVVAQIKESPIREQLVASLDVWASVKSKVADASDPAAYLRLLNLARQADGDSLRVKLRASLVLGFGPRYRDQARGAKDLIENPTTVWLVSSNLRQFGFTDDAIQLLRSGQLRHRDDFWLNFELGTVLLLTQPTPGASAEGVGFLRAAYAVRPQSPLVGVNLAKGLMEMGQTRESLEILSQEIESESPTALAFANRGAIRRLRMEFRAAEADGRRAVELEPDSAWCAAQLGYTLVLSNANEGMNLLDKAMVRDPSSGEVRTLRGMAFIFRQLPRRAIPEFEKAIKLNPILTEGWAGLAMARADASDVAGSLQASRKAIGLNHDSPTAHLAHGYALALAGRDVESASEFDAALKIDPNNPNVLMQQGLALCRRKKFAPALKAFRKVEELYPGVASVHSNLGYVFAELKRLDQAAASCRRAIELDPRMVVAYSNLGNVLILQEKFQEAAAAFRRAIELDPECQPAFCNLGNVLLTLGSFKDAEDACKKAIALDPGDSDSQINLGNVYLHLYRFEEAITCFQTADKMSPNNPVPPTNLAGVYLAQERYDEAMKSALIGLNRDETYHKAHYAIGLVLNHKHQHADAIKHLKRAMELSPNDFSCQGSLAEAYFGAGERDRAEKCLRTAMGLVGDDVTGRVALADAAKKMGRDVDVLTLLRRAIELEQEFGDAHRFLRDFLRDNDRFIELLAFYRTADRRFRADQSLTKSLEKLIEGTERLVEVERRLPAVLRGEDRPASPRETLEFAKMCLSNSKQFNAAAVRFYLAATAEDPKLLDVRNPMSRYDALCAALLAAAGSGVDVGGLRATERDELRSQAFRWATAELQFCSKQQENADKETLTRLRKRYTHWKADKDLVSVRDNAELTKIPEAERKAWQQFWVDVDALLKKLEESAPKK